MSLIDSLPDEILESIILHLPPQVYFQRVPLVCRKWREIARFALDADGKLYLDCRICVRDKVGRSALTAVTLLGEFLALGSDGLYSSTKASARPESSRTSARWCGVRVHVTVDKKLVDRVTPESIIKEVAAMYGSRGLPHQRIGRLSFSSCHLFPIGHSTWMYNVVQSICRTLRPQALSLTIADLNMIANIPEPTPVLDSVKSLAVYCPNARIDSDNIQILGSLSSIFPNARSLQMGGWDLSSTILLEATTYWIDGDAVEETGTLMKDRDHFRTLVSHFGGKHICGLRDIIPLLHYFPSLREIGSIDFSSSQDDLETFLMILSSESDEEDIIRFPNILRIHITVSDGLPSTHNIDRLLSAISRLFPNLHEATILISALSITDQTLIRYLISGLPVEHVRFVGGSREEWEDIHSAIIVGLRSKKVSWEPEGEPFVDYFKCQ
ncbi:hypothetical protein HDU93_004381 [Gonapodya sp. JEL0774]|nr:hypothetical protein HDU93_004381 [Gonapodya sp. JEL0774]